MGDLYYTVLAAPIVAPHAEASLGNGAFTAPLLRQACRALAGLARRSRREVGWSGAPGELRLGGSSPAVQALPTPPETQVASKLSAKYFAATSHWSA